MKIVALSDLHIGKWGTYGTDLLDKASVMEGDVLWLNGDIIEPGAGVDELAIFERIGKMRSNYSHIVWVAGNNCLEMHCLTGPVKNYWIDLANILEEHGIKLLDDISLCIGDYSLIGSIGWSNGDLWVPSDQESDEPNTVAACEEAAEVYFKKTFGDRWSGTSKEFFFWVQDSLQTDIEYAKKLGKKIILGTHFVTSKEFCLYGDSPRYDYLNHYMGFNGEWLYNLADPVLAIVGHTHRRKTVTVGNTRVVNVSGAKEPVVFQL